MKPKIDGTEFGSVTIDGSRHEHDVVLRLSGKVKKRKKRLPEAVYGRSHIISLTEAKDVFEKGASCLIVGAGQQGLVGGHARRLFVSHERDRENGHLLFFPLGLTILKARTNLQTLVVHFMKLQIAGRASRISRAAFPDQGPTARPAATPRAPRPARLRRLALVAAAVVSLVPQGIGQTPVGAAFTYQGRLTDNGNPANGTYDLRLILYNAPAGGAQEGSIITLEDQTVTDGLLTVPVDFGAAVFTGQARWLEVGVRDGASVGAFAVLSPRQELTPTPQAVFAGTAAIAASASTAVGYSGNVLRIESATNANNPVLEVKDNSPGQTRLSAINFLQTNDTVRGQIAYQNPDGPMTFRVGATTRATLNANGLDINAGQISFGSVEGFRDAGANLIGTLGADSLAIGGRLHTGANTNAFAWNQFGNGTKDDALIADGNDVYVSGDIEVDGTLVAGASMNVPDGFVINVAGSPANLTIAGANGIMQIGDTTADKVGIGRVPTANSLEVAGNASKATAGSWLANSDRRLKTDIQDVQGALGVIERLRPVKFRYSPEFFNKYPGTRDVCYYNYVAQEYGEVFPDSVQDDGEGFLQLDTHNAEVFSVAAIQELHRLLKEKATQISRLEKQVQALQETLDIRLVALERALPLPGHGEVRPSK